MGDMIRIRSIRDYLEEFGNNGVGKGVPVSQVKEQILDAFRKEMFDQICWKTKVDNWQDAEPTPENEKIVQNIMKQTYKKYLGVIKAFNRYRETFNMLKPEDLTLLKEQKEMYDPLDGFDDEEENDDELFCEADDPTEEELEKEEDFSDVEPAEIEGLDEISRQVAENMEEALASGYVLVEEKNEDDDFTAEDLQKEETDGGLAKGTDGEGPDSNESPNAPAGAVYGNSTEEIRPGMRFPAGFWTR